MRLLKKLSGTSLIILLVTCCNFILFDAFAQTTITPTISDVVQTYDGSPKHITVTTSPSGISYSAIYTNIQSGETTSNPINSGLYSVEVTSTDPNYVFNFSYTIYFSINKAQVQITVLENVFTYDGLPKTISVSTSPTIQLTIDDGGTGPINVGNYNIILSPVDPNYSLSTTLVQLEIQKAPVVATFDDLNHTYNGQIKLATVSFARSDNGAIVNLNPTITYLNGNTPTSPISVGTYGINITLPTVGIDRNYTIVEKIPITPQLVINPKLIDIAVSNNVHTYDGNSKSATIEMVPSLPAGVTSTISYIHNGFEFAAPSDAGTYQINVIIHNTNYAVGQLSSSSLTINPLEVNAVVSNNIATYDGLPKYATINTTPPIATNRIFSLNGVETYHPVNAGTYDISLIPSSQNYVINAIQNPTFTIKPKPLTIISTTVQTTKQFNRNTTAEIIYAGTLDGIYAGDYGQVTLTTGTANYNDYNAGTNKPISFTGFGLTGSKAGNYTLTAQPAGTTGTITTKPVTITGVTIVTKPYDGTTAATVNSAGAVDGLVGPDVLTSQAGTATFADANAGTNKTVNLTGFTLAGAAGVLNNYTLSAQPTATGTINQAPTTLSFSNTTHVYNGTAKLVTVTTTPAGVPNTITYTPVAAPTNAGTYTATVTLNSANHVISGNNTATLTINPATPTVTMTSANSGVINGTITLTANTGGSNGTLTFERQNGTGAATLAGNQLTLTSAGTVQVRAIVAASSDGNYTAATSAWQTITINNLLTPTLTLTGSTTVIYGNTLTGFTLTENSDGAVSWSVTNGTGEATYNAATNTLTATKAGTVTLVATTAQTATYAQGTASLPITITQRGLTITGTTVQTTKEYNRNASAQITNAGTLVGVLAADAGQVTLTTGTANYNDYNAGTNKPISFTGFGLAGTKAGNYVLSSQPTTIHTGIIQAKPVTITGVTIATKPYDGTTSATVNSAGAVDGLVGPDVLTSQAGTATFADANAGTNKTVNLTGFTLAGAAGVLNNYTLNAQPTATGTINQAPTTLSFSNTTHVYNGTAKSVTVTTTPAGVPNTITYTPVAAPTNAGTYTATVTLNSANHVISGNNTATLTINPATPIVAMTSANSGVINGTITLTASTGGSNGTLTFERQNGTGAATLTGNQLSLTALGTIQVRAIVAASSDGNYTAATSPWQTITINNLLTPTLTLTGSTTVEYGNTLTGFTLTEDSNGAVSWSVTNGTGEATYNAATNTLTATKAGTVTLVVTTAQTATYAQGTASLPITITQRGLTITGTTVQTTKEYNRNASAQITNAGTLNGILAADVNDVQIAVGTAVYNNFNVGTNKPISFTGFVLTGSKAGNYTLTSQPAGTTGTITAKPVTITGVTIVTKPYDGTTSATITSAGTVNGFISPDALSPQAGTATFADANVGTNKQVNLTGFSITGTGASNYVLNAQPTATGTINQAPTTLSFSNTTHVYNGTAKSVTVTTTPAGVPNTITYTPVAAPTNAGTYTATVTLNSANHVIGGNNTATLTINPATPIVAMTSANSGVINGTITLTASTGGSNGTLTFERQNGTGAATLTGNQLSLTALGTIQVRAIVAASSDGNYTAATSPWQTITINNLLTPTLTLTSPNGNTVVYGNTLNGFVLTEDSDGAVSWSVTNGTGEATYNVATSTLTATKAGTVTLVATTAQTATYAQGTASLPITITQRGLTITGTTVQTTKEYNRNASAQITNAGTLVGVLAADAGQVTLTTGTANYNDYNAGTNKPISFTGFGLAGTKAGNYVLSSQPTTIHTGIIQAKPVTITGVTIATKLYDGTTAATVNSAGVVDGLVGPDVLTSQAGTATFADANAGTNKTVNLTGFTLAGTAGVLNNYTLSAQPTATGTINQATLTATAENKTRMYGQPNPAFTISYNGFVNNETAAVLDQSIVIATTATLTSNVGTYPILLTGGSDVNYAITRVNGTLTVTQATQTITVTTQSGDRGLADGTFTMEATTTSGLPLSMVSDNTSVATVNGNTVTMHQFGTVTITVSQAGDQNYLAATPVTRTFNIVDQTRILEAPASVEITEMVLVGLPHTSTLELTNTGNASLSITNIVHDATITVSRTTLEIAPGATETIDVTVTANQTGEFTKTLTIVSNATSGNNVVEYTGTAVLITDAEVPAKSDIQLYPVPVRGILSISAEQLTLTGEIVIINLQGVTVDRQLVQEKDGVYYYDTSRLPIGNYIMKIMTTTGDQIIKRFTTL